MAIHKRLTQTILLVLLALPGSASPQDPVMVTAVQRYTGINRLFETSLNFFATMATKIKLGGKPHITIRTSSLTESLKGKFQAIDIRLKNCSYKKIPLANLHVYSSTPLQIRFFKSKKARAGLVAPVLLYLEGEANKEQITQALQSPKISAALNFLKLNLPGLGEQQLQILEPKIQLQKEKVLIDAWLVTAGAPRTTGITVHITASPVLEQERYITLQNIRVYSEDIVEPEKFAQFIQDLLNPLVDFARMDRTDHAFRLTNLEIDEQKVSFAGKLLLAPRTLQPAFAKSK